jgi:DNA-binding transcriptional MerR regulator
MALQIKQLLYEQGFTIAGARKRLAKNSGASEEKPQARLALDGLQLKAIKRELQAILTLLSQKC